ncbi:alpha/beta fold hydrolase [Nocardioides sp. Kera G14]|uniref:alpha/beta fold hydrolase n=1 Tax=Nocardioides sp. Kera G14 TaxID=2884264 RepID=UPI001D11C578|nr:alpha/beta hydrolase [Nocardioides sp. Kera G14]UDY23507.1 alpha/beta hydrolase [Nocardioides sp. Kera G14]
MPTALLVHGITNGPSTMWRFAEWLEARGWEVEAKAQLGHGGRGPAPSYTLDALGRDNVAMGDHDLVIGHSLGGSTAVKALSLRPGWTKRLVVIDPALYVGPDGNGMSVESQVAELALTAEDIQALHPAWDRRDVVAKAEESTRVDPEAVRAIMSREQEPWDLRAAISGFDIPVLLLTADPSVFSIVDPADAAAIVAANPNVTWVSVDGAGHNVHRDAPERVREVLLDWLDRTA